MSPFVCAYTEHAVASGMSAARHPVMKNRWIAPLSSLVIVFVLAACSNVGTTGGTASPTVTGTAAVTAASPTATATATTAASPAGTSPAAATATAATTGGARDVCSL